MVKFKLEKLRWKRRVSADQAGDDPAKPAKPKGRLKRTIRKMPTLGGIDRIGLYDIHKQIKRYITPKSKSVMTLGFELGEVSAPVLGVPLSEVDVTYTVNPPFQYVNVRFECEELVYHTVEPLLSDDELRYLKIIEHAFEKMTHSEIVIIGAKNREEYLRDRFSMIINIYLMKLDYFQKGKMFYHLLKKYIGYGKIDILMKDPYIEDITCNGPNSQVYVNHRIYGSIRTDVAFEEVELNNFVMKIAQTAGRHISVLQPIRDATLADGSRINITLGREVTRKGSTFTIRRFRTNPVSPVDLIKYGTFDSKQLAYLWIILEYKRSVLAAGGTASGKTTTLNALCAFIRPEYKIVSIEDTAELNLLHPNWTQSVTRTGFGGGSSPTKASGNGSGKGGAAGDIELYDLLAAALRQRPEYIVVGEVRGSEAFTLFQAISVGHPCLGTIHAGSMKELLSRVESNPMNVPRSLFSSVDNIIFNSMVKKGEHYIRRASGIVEIIEIDPDRGDLITNPIFKWDPVSDTFPYSGSCALFAGIRAEFGVPEGYLLNELNDRAELLNYLAKNDITDYERVVNAIRTYSRDKDAMMEKMA
ncbi:MAG: type II/IV secretion system ATPase subunit [Candidatus Methanogasteraceae archaeon]